MLIGRATELRTVADLLARLAGGGSGALMVAGSPGMGKTTLLGRAYELAGKALVLEAQGIEAESTLAFAGLADLLRPLSGKLDALPAPQAAALAGALALGPPVPGDRLAVSVATLGLLAAAAEVRPVLVIVDDAHWLDPSSLEAVLFAARRPPAGVVLVLAKRDFGGRKVSDHGLDVLHLDPLPDDDALALLERVAPDLAPSARASVTRTAAGNPLALEQLPGMLTEDQRHGRGSLVEPLIPGDTLEGAFAARASELPETTRVTLLMTAASSSVSFRPILDAGGSRADLERCESAGLLELGSDSVAFPHPLVRAAIYHRALPAERRAAHRALAEVEPEARAWHLAAAAIGPDEQAAQALEEAAIVASTRRAPAEAADALERAARLSENPRLAFSRLLGAGVFAMAAGRVESADALLDEASQDAPDALSRGRVDHMRGLLLFWNSRVADAFATLEPAAVALAASDPAEAAPVLASAALVSTVAGHCTRALELAERAVGLLGAEASEAARAPVFAVHHWTLFVRGHGDRARAALNEATRLAETLDPISPEALVTHFGLNMQLANEDFAETRERTGALVAAARETGALMALPALLITICELDYRMGSWEGLDDLLEETAVLCQETKLIGGVAFVLVNRARLAAAQGRAEDCEAHSGAAAVLGAAVGGGVIEIYAEAALGFGDLGAGHVDSALEHLERTEELTRLAGVEEPTIIPWAPDLIEAYVRLERQVDADRVLKTLTRQAGGTGTRLAAAFEARCRGLVVAEGFDEHFLTALDHHDCAPLRFERARTLLAFGSRLHRTKRRSEARERLREALETFNSIGAEPWSVRARAELRSAGGGPKVPVEGAELSPSERRVAAAAADGLSTREVASKLFLSPKTVEFHLSRIYRKLGIRSRAGIAKALAAREDTVPGD
jgi:DNA-binding CsgD family transcriptional regulator